VRCPATLSDIVGLSARVLAIQASRPTLHGQRVKSRRRSASYFWGLAASVRGFSPANTAGNAEPDQRNVLRPRLVRRRHPIRLVIACTAFRYGTRYCRDMAGASRTTRETGACPAPVVGRRSPSGYHAAVFSDGHLSHDTDRLAATRAWRAAAERALRSAATSSPVP